MPKPVLVTPEMITKLIAGGYLSYQVGDYSVLWLGQIHTFSEGAHHCFEILWKNFTRGNLPMPQGRLLTSWPGKCSQASDLLKRQSIWKTVVVGDGKGNLWLHIPKSILEGLAKGECSA